MKKFSIGLIVGVILGSIISLGYLFFNDNKKEVIENLEQKKEEVTILKQTVDTLQKEVDSLRARKSERIEVVKQLPPKEKIVYLEKKLDEVDDIRTDSISFLPEDSTKVSVSIEDISRINGIIEEREILKEEVVLLDSIIVQKDSIIAIQDTIIIEQDVVIQKQKKEKKKILGITVGSGGAIVLTALLLILL